jgi:CAAX protease family protein
MSLVEIDCLGIGDRCRIGSSRRRPGLSHRVRKRARVRRVRKLPLWLITLIVVRAGVVEELFYRGYAIERLRMIGLGPFWSVTIPLVIFSLGHWSGGAANILIAVAAGIILTGFYLWRRDLVANMIGHGLVDFVANVLPQLFS